MYGFHSSSPGYLHLAAAIDPLPVDSSLLSTMRNKKSKYFLINLNSIDNKTMACAVLLRTEKDYKEALNLFNL
jgi:hypothetical protein